MFSIPGTVCLLVFIYLKPQEYLPSLKTLPLLNIFLALGIFGYAIDLRLRRTRPIAAPTIVWAFVFMGWCLLVTGLRVPGHLFAAFIELSIPLTLYLLIAHSVQTFRAFQVLAVTIMVIVLYLSIFGTHQGLAPTGCFAISATTSDGDGVYDGRLCTNHRECENAEAEPGAEYMCEHVGLFGTSSIGGRVRYIGKLHDPNELAMAIAVGLPFAFALFERKRSNVRAFLALGLFAMAAACEAFSESRGGQLVFLTVLGAYFVKRQGWKGLIYGGIIALPILLFGGRSGEEAESSSKERIDCWYEGMQMLRAYPIIGVGQQQFVEHHTQTAHNSYILAAAELGFFGLNLFSIMLYLSMKIPVTALRRLGPGGPNSPDRGAADVARTWGMALLAGWAGFLVGIFFLSFCYHQILWIYFGLIGAYYSAMKVRTTTASRSSSARAEWFIAVGHRRAADGGAVRLHKAQGRQLIEREVVV